MFQPNGNFYTKYGVSSVNLLEFYSVQSMSNCLIYSKDLKFTALTGFLHGLISCGDKPNITNGILAAEFSFHLFKKLI